MDSDELGSVDIFFTTDDQVEATVKKLVNEFPEEGRVKDSLKRAGSLDAAKGTRATLSVQGTYRGQEGYAMRAVSIPGPVPKDEEEAQFAYVVRMIGPQDVFAENEDLFANFIKTIELF